MPSKLKVGWGSKWAFAAHCYLGRLTALSVILTAACIWDAPAIEEPLAASGSLRVASWNAEWVGEETTAEEWRTKQAVFAELDADVVALQEIQDRAAAEKLAGPDYAIAIAELAGEDQELAIAVRRPLKFKDNRLIFPEAKHEFAFPGGRDALWITLENPAGGSIEVVSVHFKSRRGGRKTTDPQREEAAAKLAEWVKTQGNPVIIAGDFNDTPDDRSVNILETGDPKTAAGADQGELLDNPFDELWAKDHYSLGVRDYFDSPIMRGARAEDTRLRGRDYDFATEARIKQALFDQILLAPELAQKMKGSAAIHFSDAAKSRSSSDHLPVWIDLKL
jgi:endonuclease/exonuclease/phosphatase family metal-dependent hydrolase